MVLPTAFPPTRHSRPAPSQVEPDSGDVPIPQHHPTARSDWFVRAPSGLAVVLWAVAVAQWTPRGPQTTSEAVWSIVLSLAVGGLVGWSWRSRWTILFAPIAFAIIVEFLRVDLVGPSVDAIHTSTFGIFALITGRGVHGLLSLLPIAVGAAVGAGARRRRDRGGARARGAAGRTGTVVVGLALAGLAGLIRPASTAPITGPDGQVLPDSVAELTSLDVNGHELGLMIRGHDVNNPVLLFLAGGPGGSELGAMRRHLASLEAHVTVVTWDQRGTGTSYNALDPTETLTLDGVVADTIAVTNHLRERFDTDRILLGGQSWGTTLGVLATQQAPELYSGFVGSGQMVSQRETDRIMYADTVAWARRTGQDELAAELVDVGEPPYDDILNYEVVLSNPDVEPYDHSVNSEGEAAWSENFIVQEYSLLDQAHMLTAFMDTYSVLYPQLQDIDFRESATSFEVPMFFVQGAHEARGRAELFEQWYSTIVAPTKDVVTLATSGHRPLWEQPDEFVAYVADTVLPAIATDG